MTCNMPRCWMLGCLSEICEQVLQILSAIRRQRIRCPVSRLTLRRISRLVLAVRRLVCRRIWLGVGLRGGLVVRIWLLGRSVGLMSRSNIGRRWVCRALLLPGLDDNICCNAHLEIHILWSGISFNLLKALTRGVPTVKVDACSPSTSIKYLKGDAAALLRTSGQLDNCLNALNNLPFDHCPEGDSWVEVNRGRPHSLLLEAALHESRKISVTQMFRCGGEFKAWIDLLVNVLQNQNLHVRDISGISPRQW